MIAVEKVNRCMHRVYLGCVESVFVGVGIQNQECEGCMCEGKYEESECGKLISSQ